MKNRFLYLSLALFLAISFSGKQTARAQTAQPAKPQAEQAQQPTPQQELAAYIKENYTKREVMIPMRDGVKLFTSIYEPKARAEKYPILLSRTPYTVAPYGEDKFKMSIGPNEVFPREG